MSPTDWKRQYERARLVAALGQITEGGIVEAIEHIGATSVPGLNGSACLDIGPAVWPFPLDDEQKSRLESLGYQILEGFTGSPQQRFRHASGSIQLLVFESGIGKWFDYVLIRFFAGGEGCRGNEGCPIRVVCFRRLGT